MPLKITAYIDIAFSLLLKSPTRCDDHMAEISCWTHSRKLSRLYGTQYIAIDRAIIIQAAIALKNILLNSFCVLL